MQNMVERLFNVIGRPDMITDTRFATNSSRLANVDECERPIAEFIEGHDYVDVMAVFKQADVTVAPVYEVDQVLDDPHVVERETLIDVPDADLGMLAMHNVVPRLSSTPGAIRSHAPLHGEHSIDVLTALGFDGSAIEDLVNAGVVSLGTATPSLSGANEHHAS
jgi:formyl-CoA transferase